MAESLLSAHGLTKRFGALAANDAIDLELRAGEIHAVIGPNGAGKTTLVSLLTGEQRPDAGRVILAGEDVTRLPAAARCARGLARSFQITSLLPGFTARESVAMAVQAHAGHSFRFWADADADRALNEPALARLDQVGLRLRAEVRVEDLAHGEQRQLEIAMALATRPNILLLDEPMAGMGLEESQRLVALLGTIKGRIGILLIEHDMQAVYALADRITVLVYGRVIASGEPGAIRGNAEVRSAYLGEEG